MSNEIKGVSDTFRQVSKLASSVRSPRGVDGTHRLPQGGVDSVALTQTVARLQAIEAQLASIPVVDTGRVSGIRQAMNDGDYQVAYATVADKLMGFEYQRHASMGAPE